jgi:hypothetical protein
LTHRGYVLHTVTPDRWLADYRFVADVSNADSEVTSLGTYAVDGRHQHRHQGGSVTFEAGQTDEPLAPE